MMLLLIVILVYWLATNTGPVDRAVEINTAIATETPGAADILKERYAKGEIDLATYQAMRKEVS